MDEKIYMIPIVDIKRFIEITNKKNKSILNQNYEEAARLRDEERTIESEYPCLSNYNPQNLSIEILRDKKIDLLLDDREEI